MKRKVLHLIGLLFCPLFFMIQTGFSNPNDTIIVITKPATPERLAQIKARQDSIANALGNQMDSSRFVTNKIKDRKESNFISKTIFKVNENIFGRHTEFIKTYVSSYHQNFGERLSRIQTGNKAYFKLIDNVMKRYNLPKEMKSLAIIESAMNCNAVSPVGAVGPWQFMEGTAKMLGLRVDEQLDERRDFYKSTNAAARYLKQLHSMFHDWLLVIASYNCGPAPVLRAINGGEGRSFWDIRSKLPKETQNHVMAFIATTAFYDKFTNVLALGASPKGSKMNNLANGAKDGEENDGDTDVEDKVVQNKPQFTAEELSSMAILKVKGVYNINVIAKVLNEDPVRLKRWNPTFDEDIKQSSAPIHLRLPVDKIETFIIAKEHILSECMKAR